MKHPSLSLKIAGPVLCTAAALTAGSFFSSLARADVTLVENGTARAAIVLPEKPWEEEARAAKEIQVYLNRISGATLDVVTQGADLKGRTPVLIGRAAPDALAAAVKQKSQDSSAFALFADSKQVALRGLDKVQTPRTTDYAEFSKKLDAERYDRKRLLRNGTIAQGTRHAATELLEQLGVRWFFPGELGTVIPQMKTVVVKDQQTVQIPSFPARHMSGVRNEDWSERMRHGGTDFPSSHGVPGFGYGARATYFKEHPEYYSLIDGQRAPKQLCLSNAEVVKIAVENTKKFFRALPQEDMIGMGANDGRGFCECPNCKALDGGDYDPFGPAESVTDRYIWFFNQVLDGIKDEFPDKRIGFYAYSIYNRPPVKWKPSPRIVPAVALITICRIHGIGNPICPEKSYQQDIVRGWGELVPEVYDRGYWFNLADPGNPFFMISRVSNEIPLGKKLGIAGWRVESAYNWSGSAPSLYVASRLMWDVNTDVPALLADFYTKFYGPAAKPMQIYIETMDHAVHTADYHAGSAWDVPNIYHAAVRDTARKALTEAAQLAPKDTQYAERVEVYRKHFDYMEAFIAVLETRAAHDFAASMEALQKIDTLRDDLRNRSVPLISRKADDYMKRFYRVPTQQAHERTTGGNQLVAALPNQWHFQPDPKMAGTDQKLWDPAADKDQWQNTAAYKFVPKPDDSPLAINMNVPTALTGTWQTVKPYTTTWSDIGLRHYKGHAWYRQSVMIPEKFKGQRIFLWFGGVDEEANVFVNGQNIGRGRGSFRPFELDATEAVRPGQANIVVVQAINDALNELGTGGIVAPVMFYAPVKGKDAVPQGGIAPKNEDIEIIAE